MQRTDDDGNQQVYSPKSGNKGGMWKLVQFLTEEPVKPKKKTFTFGTLFSFKELSDYLSDIELPVIAPLISLWKTDDSKDKPPEDFKNVLNMYKDGPKAAKKLEKMHRNIFLRFAHKTFPALISGRVSMDTVTAKLEHKSGFITAKPTRQDKHISALDAANLIDLQRAKKKGLSIWIGRKGKPKDIKKFSDEDYFNLALSYATAIEMGEVVSNEKEIQEAMKNAPVHLKKDLAKTVDTAFGGLVDEVKTRKQQLGGDGRAFNNLDDRLEMAKEEAEKKAKEEAEKKAEEAEKKAKEGTEETKKEAKEKPKKRTKKDTKETAPEKVQNKTLSLSGPEGAYVPTYKLIGEAGLEYSSDEREEGFYTKIEYLRDDNYTARIRKHTYRGEGSREEGSVDENHYDENRTLRYRKELSPDGHLLKEVHFDEKEQERITVYYNNGGSAHVFYRDEQGHHFATEHYRDDGSLNTRNYYGEKYCTLYEEFEEDGETLHAQATCRENGHLKIQDVYKDTKLSAKIYYGRAHDKITIEFNTKTGKKQKVLRRNEKGTAFLLDKFDRDGKIKKTFREHKTSRGKLRTHFNVYGLVRMPKREFEAYKANYETRLNKEIDAITESAPDFDPEA